MDLGEAGFGVTLGRRAPGRQEPEQGRGGIPIRTAAGRRPRRKKTFQARMLRDNNNRIQETPNTHMGSPPLASERVGLAIRRPAAVGPQRSVGAAARPQAGAPVGATEETFGPPDLRDYQAFQADEETRNGDSKQPMGSLQKPERITVENR